MGAKYAIFILKIYILSSNLFFFTDLCAKTSHYPLLVTCSVSSLKDATSLLQGEIRESSLSPPVNLRKTFAIC